MSDFEQYGAEEGIDYMVIYDNPSHTKLISILTSKALVALNSNSIRYSNYGNPSPDESRTDYQQRIRRAITAATQRLLIADRPISTIAPEALTNFSALKELEIV